ncbi:uncharacterized protein MYCFIDRAFT_204458 [Pseudocercospora fijiensis CIRAD86]|uniref:Uncharacterized protein n=1 Tax=Pseudocercospora fijiensis (strain CIRAD86) TaxID=383855 RepID=M3A673_PSEFD|nr:uncharacterized protein MYCFIDRAFT_204458 [Pseudocercospora fijiensis CIRAD86]EME80111.1 hypothetical protein MYCFIDRAFT_204458 [Pseudocercospora fijiensis CIRAD86]
MTSYYSVTLEWKAGLIDFGKIRNMASNLLLVDDHHSYARFFSSDRLFNQVFVQVVRGVAWAVLALMAVGVLIFAGLMIKESIRKHREALKDDEFNATDIDVEAGIGSAYVDEPPKYEHEDAPPPVYSSEEVAAPPAYHELSDRETSKATAEVNLQRPFHHLPTGSRS